MPASVVSRLTTCLFLWMIDTSRILSRIWVWYYNYKSFFASKGTANILRMFILQILMLVCIAQFCYAVPTVLSTAALTMNPSAKAGPPAKVTSNSTAKVTPSPKSSAKPNTAKTTAKPTAKSTKKSVLMPSAKMWKYYYETIRITKDVNNKRPRIFDRKLHRPTYCSWCWLMCHLRRLHLSVALILQFAAYAISLIDLEIPCKLSMYDCASILLFIRGFAYY